jgi:hypothetical protein
MNQHFLARPSPQEGESLSFWRQRAARANGFALFPLRPGELRRRDHDLGGDLEDLEWLEDRFGLPVERLRQLTLASLVGSVFRSADGRSHQRWLLESRYSRTGRRSGPMFCPACLDGKAPYFRLAWRLGFITECPIHQCELLDRCPACGAGVWPHGSTSTELFASRLVGLDRCLFCEHRLGDGPVIPSPSVISGRLLRLTRDRQLQLGEVISTSLDYFEALASICHLFLRRRSNRRISGSRSQWQELAVKAQEWQTGNQVGQVGIAGRRGLVEAASAILCDWPRQFLRFADATNISEEHFSDGLNQVPGWMRSVIDTELRRQRRGITVSDVKDRIAQLQSEGRKVTKADVQREFDVSEANAIGLVLRRRSVATAEELDQMLLRLDLLVESAAARKSSKEAAVRNAAVILTSILAKRELATVAAFSEAEVKEILQKGDASAICGRLKSALSSYDGYRRRSQHSATGEVGATFFKAIRGDRTVAREAQRFLSAAMATLEGRLARSPMVFSLSLTDLTNDERLRREHDATDRRLETDSRPSRNDHGLPSP